MATVLERINPARSKKPEAGYDAAKIAARLAKAKGAHDELIATALRAQADALKIQATAKCRLADEYDAAQERGEVRGQGNIPNENVSKLADIGLTAKEVHEARQIRDAEKAEPGIISKALDEMIEVGEEPTKAAVRRLINGAPATHRRLSAAGKQLANLRKAWREACPAVRQHFLTEINERVAA